MAVCCSLEAGPAAGARRTGSADAAVAIGFAAGEFGFSGIENLENAAARCGRPAGGKSGGGGASDSLNVRGGNLLLPAGDAGA